MSEIKEKESKTLLKQRVIATCSISPYLLFGILCVYISRFSEVEFFERFETVILAIGALMIALFLFMIGRIIYFAINPIIERQ